MVLCALLAGALCLPIVGDKYVPGQFPTIQIAIDAASDGDVIHVDRGLYIEAVDFLGKAITVTATAGADQTTILATPGNPGVRFWKGEGPGSILEGFTVTGGDFATWGGGITLADWADTGVGPVIRDCVIKGNKTGSIGGGIGGYNANPTIERCTVVGNEAMTGAGIAMTDGGVALISDSTVVANMGFSLGGGIHAGDGAQVIVRRTVIAHNTVPSGGRGGGVYAAGGGAQISLDHCTLSGNTAGWEGGGGAAGNGGILDLHNSIVWGNMGGPAPSLVEVHPTSVVTASWSDVEGGWPGVGMIDADPLFADPSDITFLLQAGSPCIDAGDPAGPMDPDGSVADQGAAPFGLPGNAWTDLGFAKPGWSGDPLLTGTGNLLPGTPATVTLTQAAPFTNLFLIVGTATSYQPVFGGTLVPQPSFWMMLPTDVGGASAFGWPSTPALPPGFQIFFQAWILDPVATFGLAASNGLAGTIP